MKRKNQKNIGKVNGNIPTYEITFEGVEPNAYTGQSVGGAGDVNNDGVKDFLIGSNIASVYLLYGNKDIQSFPSIYPLENLGSPGNTAGVLFDNGASYAGTSIAGVGDVNHDGIDDFLIGAPSFNGFIYLIYGHNFSNPFSPSFQLNTIGTPGNTDGVLFQGANSGDAAGNSVSGTGDINGDGINDFFIGASDAYSREGAAYLIFGRNSNNPFPSSFQLSSLGSTGNMDGVIFKASSYDIGGYIGKALSGAGDVNSDGNNDLLIGATNAYNYYGATFLVYGRNQSNPFPPTFLLDNLGSTGNNEGVVFKGSYAYSNFGWAVSGARDVNQDNIPDVLMSNGNTDTYLIYGRNSSNPFPPSFSINNMGNPGNMDGVVFNGAGFSLSDTGDVNQDGINDMLLGNPNYGGAGNPYNTGNGTAYVVFGRSLTNPFPPMFELTSLTPNIAPNSNGTVFYGGAADSFGYAVIGPGDLNNDGTPDLLIGARTGPNESNTGFATLISGQVTQITARTESENLPKNVPEKVIYDDATPNDSFLLPGVKAGSVYEMPIHTFFGNSHLDTMTAGADNSTSSLKLYYSTHPEHDQQTNARIFTVHAIQKNELLGSIRLLGQPKFCRSLEGNKHNVVGLSGIFAGHEQEIERIETNNVCDVVRPEQVIFNERADNAANHGIIVGASNILQKVLERNNVNQTLALAASQASYYTSLFMMYYLQHQSKSCEVIETEDNCYESATHAATQTGMVMAINAVGAGATYLAKKCEAKKWTYGACFFKATRSVLNVARFAPQVVNAYNQPNLQSRADVIVESASLMALGMATQKLTEDVGDVVLNSRIGLRK